jgi:hypothetical protein
MPTIINAVVTLPESFGKMARVNVLMSDGTTPYLFDYYSEEISFTDEELVGLTERQAHDLKGLKDSAYLKS